MTSEEILALAPDASSAKAGRELAVARKWLAPGAQPDRVIWGECQGSGKSPYRTVVDLSGPAFNCTCPSRKFPCKHGLGLLLLSAESAASFSAGSPPQWVEEWLAGRAKRAEKKAEASESKAKAPPDPAAAAKRSAQRSKRVDAGIAALELWLSDLVRNGLAHAHAQPAAFWSEQARRLVDAQAPGLAGRVRGLGEAAASGTGWQSRVLDGLGRLHLLLQAYRNIESLPPDVQADVRTQIGWTGEQDELLQKDGLVDDWQVLGISTTEEEQLIVQRSWLRGRVSRRDALVLSFFHSSQRPEASVVAGTCFHGELVFYPGNQALRALIKSRAAPATSTSPPDACNIGTALAAYGAAIARNPWLGTAPLVLDAVVPTSDDRHSWLRDEAGDALPIASGFDGFWRMAAFSGGHPLTVCGEWDGERLRPLAAWRDNRRIGL